MYYVYYIVIDNWCGRKWTNEEDWYKRIVLIAEKVGTFFVI